MAKKQNLSLVHKVMEVVTTDSMTVGEVFGKEHFHVVRDIRDLQCSDSFKEENFREVKRIIEIGNGAKRLDPYYELTKDGFFLLAMGYTGQRAMQFKEAYITAFNAMERELRERDEARALASTDELFYRAFPYEAADVMAEQGMYSPGRLGGFISNYGSDFAKRNGTWWCTANVKPVMEASMGLTKEIWQYEMKKKMQELKAMAE